MLDRFNDTALALASMYERARQLKGTPRLESNGKGAIVRIAVPVIQ